MKKIFLLIALISVVNAGSDSYSSLEVSTSSESFTPFSSQPSKSMICSDCFASYEISCGPPGDCPPGYKVLDRTIAADGSWGLCCIEK